MMSSVGYHVDIPLVACKLCTVNSISYPNFQLRFLIKCIDIINFDHLLTYSLNVYSVISFICSNFDHLVFEKCCMLLP